MDMLRLVLERYILPIFAPNDCLITTQEAEACDHFGGFFLMQSVAGGTGSGFGKQTAY